jgi:hypothetical protein
MIMSQTALTPDHEPCIFEPFVASVLFNGARLLQPILYKTLHGLPIHVYAQEHPVPAASYPSGEHDWIDVSLRGWAKSTKTHTTDQNHLCEYRYDKYIYCKGAILPAAQTATVWQMEPPRVRERDEVTGSFRLDEDVQAEVNAARDFDRSDPGSRTAWHSADPSPFPHQEAAVDLQRFWYRDPKQRRSP